MNSRGAFIAPLFWPQPFAHAVAMAASAQPALIRLVADDPIWRDQLHLALEQDGFLVEQQPSPKDLKHLLNSSPRVAPPDLWLVNLPSGCHPLDETLRWIKRHSRQQQPVPLLLLADVALEDERAELLDAGADDVLVRPFGLRELVARCRAIVRRIQRLEQASRVAEAGEVLKVGELALYRDQCRVCLNGETVNLTPREFRLLEFFMLHPGRVLSRDQILEQVWGSDYSGNSKSVDVHVLWLRRKLNHPARSSGIITVRGIGYRLDPPRM